MHHFVFQAAFPVIFLILVTAHRGVVTAADAPLPEQSAAATAKQPAGNPTGDSKADASKANDVKTGEAKTDDPLFDRLRKESSSEIDEDENPLERAIAAMRDVQKRIGKNETGLRTRQMQQRIVNDLEKLIELARRQPPAVGNPNQRQPEPQQKPQKQPSPQPKPNDSNSPGRRRNNPRDSDSRIDKGKLQKARLARHRQLTKEIWGHLPEKLRQRLRNVESDKYVQKYNDVILRYFEALAEQSRSGERGSGVGGRK